MPPSPLTASNYLRIGVDMRPALALVIAVAADTPTRNTFWGKPASSPS